MNISEYILSAKQECWIGDLQMKEKQINVVGRVAIQT